MKNLFKLSLIAILALSLSLESCKKKDNDEEADTDIVASEDQSNGENNFDQVFKEVDEAANGNGLKKGGPAITFDTMANPRTMTIDYGSDPGTNGMGMLCKDGNYRMGIIMITWTGKFREAGTVKTITPTNFYQNGNKIEGTKTVTNLGRNADGNMQWSIVVTGTITQTTGEIFTWNSNRTRTWVAGENTPLLWNDDKYEVTGTTSGVNRKGRAYTATVTKPVLIDLGCKYRMVSGTVELVPEGKASRTIDFGNGACDAVVSVTIKGKTHTFSKK